MKYVAAVLLFMLFQSFCIAQQYDVLIKFTGKDNSFKIPQIKPAYSFADNETAIKFIENLPELMFNAGFPAASIDSVNFNDSVYTVNMFCGPVINSVLLDNGNINKAAFRFNKYVRLNEINKIKSSIINWYGNNGYPFAKVYLDSISFEKETMKATLMVDTIMLYRLDSIRINGKAGISNSYMQQYLGIPRNSVYNSQKLSLVDKKITDNSFVSATQPSKVNMLGSGAVLDLFLKPKKSSRFDIIIGLLPDATQSGKLLITGDINLDLQNAFGSGEKILFKWQQLQKKSPRLNMGFSKPYLFSTPYGVDASFNLYKKDSQYLKVNATVGLMYNFSSDTYGKLFSNFQITTLLAGAVDTLKIKSSGKLPEINDVSSVNIGLNYFSSKTNYKFNPTKGFEFEGTLLTGLKKIKVNADILSISDPQFDYRKIYDSLQNKQYQLRLNFVLSKYFKLKNASTLKVSVSPGLFLSPSIFANELFRIGGYNLLRGFDEESIYADKYFVASTEYRLLTGINSHLFSFVDLGWVGNKISNTSNTFAGAGIGLVLETKLGLLNVSYAVGKQSNKDFRLREASKIHFGYINYF